MRIPKSKSPVKTNLGSPAVRDRRLGPVSPARGSVVTSPQTNNRERSVARRLDFGAAAASLPKPGTAELTNGYHTPEDDDDVDEEAILRGAAADDEGDDEDDEPVNVDEFLEITGTGFYDAQAELERVSAENSQASIEEEEAEEEEEDEEEETVVKVAASKRRGRPARPAPIEDEEDEEPAPAPKRRGRPPKNKTVEAPAPQSNPKRRRSAQESLGDDEDVAAAAEESEAEEAPQPKRQRTDAKGQPAAQEAAPKKRGRKRRSSGGVADVSVVVPRGPPLPKSRGLLIARRETPGDGAMTQTRSGRQSYRPLAFWRNERVDYDPAEVVDDGRGGRFLLPAVREIHRVDEDLSAAAPKTRRKPAGRPAAAASHNRRRGGRGHQDDDDDDGPAAPWEEEGDGTMSGEVLLWRPEFADNPPAQDDEVELTTERVAVSHEGAQPHEVRGASFGFVKTLSLPFFGAGVVDLPPGAEKRPKNSRKMHMTFFVFSGKVLVTVADTSFRISKGGMWFVPRGEFSRAVLFLFFCWFHPLVLALSLRWGERWRSRGEGGGRGQ